MAAQRLVDTGRYNLARPALVLSPHARDYLAIWPMHSNTPFSTRLRALNVIASSTPPAGPFGLRSRSMIRMPHGEPSGVIKIQGIGESLPCRPRIVPWRSHDRPRPSLLSASFLFLPPTQAGDLSFGCGQSVIVAPDLTVPFLKLLPVCFDVGIHFLPPSPLANYYLIGVTILT